VRRFGWNASVTLTPTVSGELKWWSKTLSHNAPQSLRRTAPGATLVTDASPWGWGASLRVDGQEDVRAWDVWGESEQKLTSNHREFLAILLSLKNLQAKLARITAIRIRSDNTTAVYNILRWRGVRQRIPALRELWNLCRRNNWTLTPEHLPGVDNSEADALSRMGPSSEFHLNWATWRAIQERMTEQATLDVFASRMTHMLPRYMTLSIYDARACAVDGLSASWEGEVVLLHPPLNLICSTLRKAELTRAKGVIVLPDWRGQPWFSLLQRLSQGEYQLGPYTETMTRSATMIAKGLLLPPGIATTHFLGMKMTEAKSCLTN
jgi:ribonuclease HI